MLTVRARPQHLLFPHYFRYELQLTDHSGVLWRPGDKICINSSFLLLLGCPFHDLDPDVPLRLSEKPSGLPGISLTVLCPLLSCSFRCYERYLLWRSD